MARNLSLLGLLASLAGCVGPSYQEAREICHYQAKKEREEGKYSHTTVAWMACMRENGHEKLFQRSPYWSEERCGVSGFYCAPPHNRHMKGY